jgi:hypothetical protein
MSVSGKKPGVAFWATVVVVVVLIGYPFSIGPAGWITDNVSLPDPIPYYWTFYAPIIWAHDHAPEPISEAMDWYADLWWD